jgi:hypothetical protein
LFPSSSYNSTSYYVDVVFTTSGGGPAGTVPGTSSSSSATATRGVLTRSAAFGADPVMDANHPITTVVPAGADPSSVKMTVVTAALVPGQEWRVGTPMPGKVSYDPRTRTVSVRPDSPLLRQGSYKVLVTATSGGEEPMQPITWTISPNRQTSRVPGQGAPTGVAPGALPGPASDTRKRVFKNH